LASTEGTAQKLVEKRKISLSDLKKYDATPLYLYTEKDGLNRVTVLKELGKEIYLVAGRYSSFQGESRLYNPLTNEEKTEIEKLLRLGRKDALISFL
jgi:hypothetical protein